MLFLCNDRVIFIDASRQSSMRTNPLPPSLLDTQSLTLSSLGCKVQSIVFIFFVLWSICLNSLFVLFRNYPEYFTKRTALAEYSELLSLFYSLKVFHTRQLMVFHWSLSDNKSPQVSRTRLSIQVDHNNVIVWMVSTRPLISKSSSPFTNL